MPAVSREGDSLSTGHICVSTTVLDTPTQSSVRANSILIARKTDPTVSHPNPPSPPGFGTPTKATTTRREVDYFF